MSEFNRFRSDFLFILYIIFYLTIFLLIFTKSIKKGDVYESHRFTVKDDKFKSEPFLREVKEIYIDLINRHISDPKQQLKAFDKNSIYLPTKKIGKNNPKAAEIEADNTARQEMYLL